MPSVVELVGNVMPLSYLHSPSVRDIYDTILRTADRREIYIYIYIHIFICYVLIAVYRCISFCYSTPNLNNSNRSVKRDIQINGLC